MKSVKRLMQFIKPYWWRVAIAAVASSAYGAMDGAFAYLIEPVLSKIFVTKDMTVFSLLPFAIILLFMVRGGCKYLNEYFMRTAGQLAVQDVRNEIFKKNIYLDLQFFSRNQTGSLMSRILNDVYMMQEGIGNIITSIFRDGIGAIALLVVVFYRNWQLAIITFLVIPLILYPAQLIGKKIKQISRTGQEKAGDITSVLQEALTGIKVIKAFGMERRVIQLFSRANLVFYQYMRKTIKYSALSSPVSEVIISLGIATVVFVGGRKVMAGSMSAPEFFSFITAMALCYSPLKKLITSYQESQRCLGASERVFEIIDEVPAIMDSPDAVTISRAEGCVEFRNVGFGFSDTAILKNINLTTQRGEVVALVGPSGAGKSTMVSLIARFYDVSEGAVCIDSIDIRSIQLESLLQQIALVDQETILFNDTIAGNIRYGKADATDEEIISAAQSAFAHDFIAEMPEGYETNIGDRGVKLSGGQRQRICIARALLKNAPILILDEATSALDTESEQMVQEALENLMKNRTTFVIAHRLSTILHADKIVVLENGEIREQGSHNDLLAANGLYKRLYDMQFKD